jgi:hypothetical protein
MDMPFEQIPRPAFHEESQRLPQYTSAKYKANYHTISSSVITLISRVKMLHKILADGVWRACSKVSVILNRFLSALFLSASLIEGNVLLGVQCGVYVLDDGCDYMVDEVHYSAGQ